MDCEGRANAQTRALMEGTDQWKPLVEYLEFAPLLRTHDARLPAPGPISIPPTPRTNSLAMAGLVMGILSITCGMCCYGLPFNLLGLVFSLVALARSGTTRCRSKGGRWPSRPGALAREHCPGRSHVGARPSR